MGPHLKAQVSFEFISLVALMFTILLVFTVTTRSQITDIREDERYMMLKDLTYAVQTEITTAASVEDGYFRTFNITEHLDGFDYNISIINGNILQLTSGSIEYVVKIPIITGEVKKGLNTINKTDGAIYVDQ